MANRAAKVGDRVLIWCPACDEPHAPKVDPPHPAPGSWAWNGSLEKPTFTPSLLVKWEGVDPPITGKKVVRICHSYVTDGQISFLGDCTHKLKGQCVDLPPWED